jgi:hypothetical protein
MASSIRKRLGKSNIFSHFPSYPDSYFFSIRDIQSRETVPPEIPEEYRNAPSSQSLPSPNPWRWQITRSILTRGQKGFTFLREHADARNMRIESSAIQISSSHSLQNLHQQSESLRVWVDQPSLTKAAISPLPCNPEQESSSQDKPREPEECHPKLFLMKKIIEAFTGKKIKEIRADFIHDEPRPACASSPGSAAPLSREAKRVGWGINYEFHESFAESEATTVSAAGRVTIADGQEIRFEMAFTLSRTFTQDTAISLRAGDALTDPLILRFTGTPSYLTDQRFNFDLNADGKDEQLPLLAQGSAFLAFDRNGDHQVNNGTELFGPRTGNGFAELSRLDETGDGWIDEADAGYGSLFVWNPGDGSEILSSLKDAGIGAISTQPVRSAFSLKDDSNSLIGQIQKSGLYLTESGQPGLIQQLDLVA